MSIKEDVKEVQEEVKNLKQETNKGSFFMELLHDLKETNKKLLVANILLAIALFIAIIGLIIKWT